MNKRFANTLADSRYGLLAVGLVFILSFLGWLLTTSQLQDLIEKEFTTIAIEESNAIEDQIEIYSNIVASGRGLFDSSEFVSRAEWHSFINSQDILNKYPGIQALEFIEIVSRANKDEFEQRVIDEGFEGFSIHPSGDRAQYFVVNYIEPITGNEPAFGFDLASNQDRLDALEKARDTNGFVVTAPIALVQDENKVPAFLAMVPFYRTNQIDTLEQRRDNLTGFVLAVFKSEGLFEDVASKVKKLSGVHFTLVDAGEEFFNSQGHSSAEETDLAAYSFRSNIEIGGRIWEFRAHAADEFLASFGTEKIFPTVITVAGILLGILLFVIFYLISRSARKSAELAKEMTNNFEKEKSKVEAVNKDLAKAVKVVQAHLKEKDNQQTAILNVLEDVEEEKSKTAKEKSKIDAILHSIGDGVFVIDEKKHLTMVNQITESICGYSSQELIGRRYDKVLHFINEATGKPNTEFIDTAFATGEVQEMTNHTILLTKTNQKVPVADSAAPLKDDDGNITGCVVVFRDVAKEREVDRMKTEFVSVASHQLRTPLSAVKWFLEMVLAGDAGKITAQQKEFLQQAFDSNERMVALVNDLLNVSRLETGRLAVDPKRTDLVKLSKTLLAELKPIIKANNIKFSFKPEPKLPIISIDEQLVSQVIMNLLSNAIKYTPGRGKVNYSIAKQGKFIKLAVQDSGIGIPKKQRKRVFEKFFRSDISIEKATEGTGLGLYVAKKIVEASGGQIGFETVEGKGSTFWFTLPLAGSQATTGDKSLEKMKI